MKMNDIVEYLKYAGPHNLTLCFQLVIVRTIKVDITKKIMSIRNDTWNGYVNLTKLLSRKKLFASKTKKPDRDNFISSPAFVFKVYIGYHCFTEKIYLQP